MQKKNSVEQEIKQWKKAEIWFKENLSDSFCADCPKNAVIFLKSDKAFDVLRMYAPLLDIISAHEIPYEVIFADFIGKKLWENDTAAAFEITP